MQRISENLFQFQDTCNVYVIRSGKEAVLIDLGDGRTRQDRFSLLESVPTAGTPGQRERGSVLDGDGGRACKTLRGWNLA